MDRRSASWLRNVVGTRFFLLIFFNVPKNVVRFRAGRGEETLCCVLTVECGAG